MRASQGICMPSSRIQRISPRTSYHSTSSAGYRQELATIPTRYCKNDWLDEELSGLSQSRLVPLTYKASLNGHRVGTRFAFCKY